MMSVERSIRSALTDALAPEHLDVVNESHAHRVPPGSESHFKVTIVSPQFQGERLLARHRRVNALLAELLAGPIHALALHTYTPEEWRARVAAKGESAPQSPPCAGAKASAKAS